MSFNPVDKGKFRSGEQTGTWQTFDRDGGLVKETKFTKVGK